MLLPECLSSRPVGVELELLMPVTVPATMPLSWDFSARWFASFGGADRRLTEQGRNRGAALYRVPRPGRPPRCELAAGRSIEVTHAGQSADVGRWRTREGDAVAAVCCCRCAWLTLNRQQHSEAGMSDTGLTVPGMTELPRRYDVTITVDRDGGDHPNPAEFAAAAEQAASARGASIVS